MVIGYLQKLRLFGRDVWLYLGAWSLVGFAYSGVFLVLFNLYLLRLGYGPEFVGLVSGVGLFALALFAMPAGALGKRWGSRPMMIAGMGLMALGFVTLPLAEFVPATWRSAWFLATWSLVSFSAPLFTVNGAPFLMAVTDPAERDYAFSMQLALFSLAGFAGGLLSGFLPGLFSGLLTVPTDRPAPFRYSLFLAGALFFVGLLMILATSKGDEERGQTGESKGAGPMPWVLITVMGVVTLLRAPGEWAPNVFFNVYLEMELAASTALIGSLVAICRLMAGLAALSMPLLVKRWGKERVIGWGIIGVALSLLPLVFIPHWSAAEFGFIGAIALSAMVSAAYFVFSQELVAPGWQAVMSGAIWMGSGIGGSFILITGGRIITKVGYNSFFLTAALLTAVGGLLFLGFFRLPRGKLDRGAAEEPAG